MKLGLRRMEKKKKILVIVIVLGVLLAVLGSLSILGIIDLIILLQGVLAFISGHLWEAVIFLFGSGIVLWVIGMAIKWYFGKKERKEILKFAGAIIGLAVIAYFPSKVLYTETDPNLQLLAIGIILSIVLGGWNMLKSLFRSAVAEELKKANELLREQIAQTRAIEEQRRKDAIKPANELLKSRLRRFISYWENKEGGLLKKLSEIGNDLKRIVLENEKLLPHVVDEVNDIADSIVILSNQTVILANENDDIRKRMAQRLIGEGDELVKRAKELIKKMDDGTEQKEKI